MFNDSCWDLVVRPGAEAGAPAAVDVRPTLVTMLTFGLYVRPWIRVEYPDIPSLGRIESTYFRPETWKPEYPNPAFERMLPEDAFWAARIVSRFSDDAIRAILETGDFRAPEAEAHLAKALDLHRKLYGPDNIQTAFIHLSLAKVALARNRRDVARAELDIVRAVQERELPPDHPDRQEVDRLYATVTATAPGG